MNKNKERIIEDRIDELQFWINANLFTSFIFIFSCLSIDFMKYLSTHVLINSIVCILLFVNMIILLNIFNLSNKIKIETRNIEKYFIIHGLIFFVVLGKAILPLFFM